MGMKEKQKGKVRKNRMERSGMQGKVIMDGEVMMNGNKGKR